MLAIIDASRGVMAGDVGVLFALGEAILLVTHHNDEKLPGGKSPSLAFLLEGNGR